MSNELELLHEGFKNELEDLESMLQHAEDFTLKAKRAKFTKQLSAVLSNLEGLCDSLYVEFENSRESEVEDLEHENQILKDLLKEQELSHEDLTYIRIKHGIELD